MLTDIVDDLFSPGKIEDGEELGSFMDQSGGVQTLPFVRRSDPAKNRTLAAGVAVIAGGGSGLIGALGFSIAGLPLVLLIVTTFVISGLFTYIMKGIFDSCKSRKASYEDNNRLKQSQPSTTLQVGQKLFPGQAVTLASDPLAAVNHDDNSFAYQAPATSPIQNLNITEPVEGEPRKRMHSM